MNRARDSRPGLWGQPLWREIVPPCQAVYRLGLMLAAFVGAGAAAASGPLGVINLKEPQVFSGSTQTVCVLFHNSGSAVFDKRLAMRIFQTSSATAALLAEEPWKHVQVLPNQTVLDSARVALPAVSAPTRFLIQWLEDTNLVIGTTKIRAYPTNLLAALKPLLAGSRLGVFDPRNRLKPLLAQLKVEFSDLGNSELEHFPGRLAILGPFDSRAQIPAGLQKRAEQLAKKGAAVIWIRPPLVCEDALAPSFYPVPKGRGLIVVVQAALVADLPENPRSQLNLIQICRLALHPEPRGLPEFTSCSRNEPQPPSP